MTETIIRMNNFDLNLVNFVLTEKIINLVFRLAKNMGCCDIKAMQDPQRCVWVLFIRVSRFWNAMHSKSPIMGVESMLVG